MASGVFGLIWAGSFGGFADGGTARGYGALCRKPPGRSIVPSSDISTASARIVWKPFECAAARAWNAIGTPFTDSCSLPHESVQRTGSAIAWSRATVSISRARRRIVSAAMPVMSAAHSGVHSATCSRSSVNDGATGVPSSSV